MAKLGASGPSQRLYCAGTRGVRHQEEFEGEGVCPGEEDRDRGRGAKNALKSSGNAAECDAPHVQSRTRESVGVLRRSSTGSGRI